MVCTLLILEYANFILCLDFYGIYNLGLLKSLLEVSALCIYLFIWAYIFIATRLQLLLFREPNMPDIFFFFMRYRMLLVVYAVLFVVSFLISFRFVYVSCRL